MKVIDRSEYRDAEGKISLSNRLRGTLDRGLGWFGEMDAQDQIAQRLGRNLGDEHIMLQNIPLPEAGVIIPMVLISPQGVRVIYPSPIRGVFRAKGDEWFAFSGGSKRFKKTRPNLQAIVMSMAQDLLNFLQNRGFGLPEVEPVLVFTNPRTHIDMARPSARIVLADAIDHFAANLQQFPPIMNRDDVNSLVEALVNPKPSEAAPEPAVELPTEMAFEAPPLEEDMATMDEFMGEEMDLTTEKLPPDVMIIGPLRMLRWQWFVIGGLAVLELVVIGIFAFLVLSRTSGG